MTSRNPLPGNDSIGMQTTMPVSRRGLLHISALATIAVLLRWRPVPAEEIDALTDLLLPLQHRETTGIIAQAYLTAHPDHTDPAQLRALLGANAGAPHLRAALDAAKREDFRQGHFLLVSGWPVAQTEARLCTLAHLTRRS